MLLAPEKQEGKRIKGVRTSKKNAERREKNYFKKMETKKNMRSRRGLFPERTRLLFAGTISLTIRTLLYGPSNNECF